MTSLSCRARNVKAAHLNRVFAKGRGWSGKFGFNFRLPRKISRAYSSAVQNVLFFFLAKTAIQMPHGAASLCRVGRKRFLRPPHRRATHKLSVQNCCKKSSHAQPPSAEQPEMGSVTARSRRVIRMGLMHAGAIEQRENRRTIFTAVSNSMIRPRRPQPQIDTSVTLTADVHPEVTEWRSC